MTRSQKEEDEDADDREYYARILGTRSTKKETVQVEDGFFGSTPTGVKSVREVEEFFSSEQKGSSAMPHKRNPITCERVAGLSRLLRGYAVAAMENVALWHERDITHSSVERVIFPDSFILAHFMVNEMQAVLKGLRVYPENMRENIGKNCFI